ncbi:MAG: NfeD family protein [Cyanobacteria bacterium P01_H01_bin.15]
MSLTTFLQQTELSPFQGRAVVECAIKPLYPGRVYFQGTYWPARLATHNSISLHPGDLVEVLGREGLTLLVRPLTTGRKHQ